MGDGIHGCTDLGTSRQGLHLLLPQRPLATSALWHKSNSVNWCSLYSSHKTLTCTAILCSLYSNHTHSLVLLSLCSLYSKPLSLTCAVVCVQSVLKTTLTHLCCLCVVCTKNYPRSLLLLSVCSLYSKPPSLTCAAVCSLYSGNKHSFVLLCAVCTQNRPHSLVLLSLCSLYSNFKHSLVLLSVCSLSSKPQTLTCSGLFMQPVLKPPSLTCVVVCVQSVLKPQTLTHLCFPPPSPSEPAAGSRVSPWWSVVSLRACAGLSPPSPVCGKRSPLLTASPWTAQTGLFIRLV